MSFTAFRKLRTHKAFRMLALSFFAVMAVSLAFAIFSYNRLLETEKNRAQEQAQAYLTQAVNVVESHIDSVYQTMIALSLDEDVISYVYRTAPLDGSDYYRMIHAQKEIGMGNVHNSCISEIGVYVRAIDMVLYSSSCRRAEDFYRSFLDFEGVSFDEWKESLNSNEPLTMKPALYSNAGGKHVFEFRLSIPSGSHRGVVIAYMDAAEIEEAFAAGDMLEDSVLSIVSGEKTLLTLGNSDLKADAEEEGWNFSDNSETLTVFESGENGRCYVLTLGKNAFFEQLINTRNYIVRMLLTELTGILLLSLIMIYINYSPMRKLLHKLGVNNPDSMSSRGTEYDHILNAAYKMLSTNEQLNLQLQKQLPVLRRSLIVQIVTTKANIDRETLREYGVTFDNPFFAVAAMDVGASGEAGAVLRYSVAALIESRYSGKVKIYSAECAQDAVLLLVNADHTRMQGLMEEICLFLKDSMALEVQIGLGQNAEKIGQIHLSYEQALEALIYARVWQQKGVVLHEEIRGFDKMDVYTVADEQELTGYIRAGNVEGAHAAIRQMYDNVKNAPSTHSQIITYGIVTTCLRLLYEWKIPGANMECAVERMIKRISGGEEAQVLLKEVLLLTGEICQTMASMKNASTSTIGDDARKIIEENYMKADFSLVSAAEMMNLSAPYLSHVFRQQNGETFVNTLNTVRLERACGLLKTTEHSASAISKMCGYSDAGYFNRVFKKKYGMTPGQYREAQGGGKDA